MAYKVLYRKYRPDSFENLYGQENIKKLLIESIKSNKISHAYIFHVPRGTGKTSTAKIFAKTINCENNSDGIPCGECNSCKNFNESNDIIEMIQDSTLEEKQYLEKKITALVTKIGTMK